MESPIVRSVIYTQELLQSVTILTIDRNPIINPANVSLFGITSELDFPTVILLSIFPLYFMEFRID